MLGDDGNSREAHGIEVVRQCGVEMKDLGKGMFRNRPLFSASQRRENCAARGLPSGDHPLFCTPRFFLFVCMNAEFDIDGSELEGVVANLVGRREIHNENFGAQEECLVRRKL